MALNLNISVLIIVLVRVVIRVSQLVVKVPLDRLSFLWRLEQEGDMLLRASLGLPSGLGHLLPDLLALSDGDATVLLPVEVALAEHLLDLGLGLGQLADVLPSGGHLLLHLLEARHPLGDLSLSLLLEKFFLLDLSPGLPPLGGGLHQVAGLALGD